MLKLNGYVGNEEQWLQPPLGGCVLKPHEKQQELESNHPAAFRRLCVETGYLLLVSAFIWPAAFRRLCVETNGYCFRFQVPHSPAAFRRLCVETSCSSARSPAALTSRL